MCRAQCILAMVALYVGLAHSWDYAVSSEDQLIFYDNYGNETNRVQFKSRNLGGLAYDVVHNRMLYVDKQNNNDAIFGYNLVSKENEYLIERSGRNILSIAYDPATEQLFFTDANEKSINWFSLKRGHENNIYGNLLIKMDDRTPDDIAVDSCGGYIYWSITGHSETVDMERARFDGSGREIVFYDYDYELFDVNSLTIDPQTKRIYYLDNSADRMSLTSANMIGVNTKVEFVRNWSETKELTVSKDYLYYVNTTRNKCYKSVWRYTKYTSGNEELKELSKFYTDGFLGLVANYKIEDQIKGINCDKLTNLKTIVEAPVNTGERCDVCVNYCLHGNCSVNEEGLPKCSCNAGYLGERCEVSACHGYCLNDGECSLNEEDDPVCQCAGNYEGARCEADVTDATATYELSNRNLTLADLQTICQKPSSRILLLVEVP